MNPEDNPIAHILPEILSLIFVKCLQLARQSKYIGYPNQRFVPLHLASVSQSWRQVAFTTFELWTTCWLSYLHPELNMLWISRSGALMFDIDGSLVPSSGHICPTAPILSFIAPHMHRCRSFSIDSSSLYGTIPEYDFRAPNLVSCEMLSGHMPLWLHDFLDHALQLRSLDIGKLYAGLGARLVNLTHLQVKVLDHPDQVLTILTTATKLSSLILGIRFGFILPSSVFSSITHNTLLHLELHIECDVDMQLFDKLTLPLLNTLELKPHIGGLLVANYFAFSAFLRRSQCALKKLSVCCLNSNSLISLLKCREPSLIETLECPYLDVTPRLLHFLCDTSNLPGLRKLFMEEVCVSQGLEFKLFGDMISSRRTPVGEHEGPNCSKLEHLKFSLSPESNYHSPYPRWSYYAGLDRIRDMVESGREDATPFVVEIEHQRIGGDSENDSVGAV